MGNCLWRSVKKHYDGNGSYEKMIFLLVILMLIAACVPVMYLSRWMSKDISGLAEQIEKYEIGAKELSFTTKDQKELKRVAGALNQW